MPRPVESARKLMKWLPSGRAKATDTDWAVVEHYRRGWVAMSDGARANPEFYMQRTRSGLVERRRITQDEQKEAEAYFDLKDYMAL